MKLRLLEIELYARDPENTKEFYQGQLGLKVCVDQEGLKVFDAGVPGVDFDKSTHFPGRVSISFFAEDIQECIETLTARGATILEKYGDPVAAIVLEDPDGCRVEIKKEPG
jgi:predicted enzyme related to lactoylglutathione lyase